MPSVEHFFVRIMSALDRHCECASCLSLSLSQKTESQRNFLRVFYARFTCSIPSLMTTASSFDTDYVGTLTTIDFLTHFPNQGFRDSPRIMQPESHFVTGTRGCLQIARTLPFLSSSRGGGDRRPNSQIAQVRDRFCVFLSLMIFSS